MTAPLTVRTAPRVTFDPGGGFPVIDANGVRFTAQNDLDAVLSTAARSGVRLYTGGSADVTPDPTTDYVTEAELAAQLGTIAASVQAGLALDADGVYYLATPAGLQVDTDGTPYIGTSNAVARVAIDTDGVPYPVAI